MKSLVTLLLLTTTPLTQGAEPHTGEALQRPRQLQRMEPEPAVKRVVSFETGQVRPLALSPDGSLLWVVNTPAQTVEAYRVTPTGLRLVQSTTVGLEPCAVAARSATEAWVVNHLSDSISVVRLGQGVVRTLNVSDEPRDIVFAGPHRDRAFVTTAHRGQNAPYDPQLTTPGIGRADVHVFDADTAAPLTILQLFTNTPRALAASPDGRYVYAAGFLSGNQTTPINSGQLNFHGPGMLPPLANAEGVPAPRTGTIAKFNPADGHWYDDGNRVMDEFVRFNLPDKDVFTIDASLPVPAVVNPTYARVGTVLFNLAVNPVTGRVYASNLESENLTRFEGPGPYEGRRGLQGHVAESRITVLDPASGSVRPRHLNKHIDYSQCCAPVPNAENDKSLAFPTEMAVTANGRTLYVAALGSSKVGIFDTRELEADTFVPSTSRHIELSGGGPTGLVLDEARDRLYVMTRFDNSISVVDTKSRAEISKVRLYNPEPDFVVEGRRFLYDARYTSSHGDSACASCHIFGDFDGLAWNLGDPNGEVLTNPGPFANDVSRVFSAELVGDPFGSIDYHPMKGPMTTQSLRGMANSGSLHWRGDRTGGNDEPNAQPGSGAFNSLEGFRKFNGAFVGLLGRHAPLSEAEMTAFGRFMLDVVYPPNPIRNLDNSDTPAQARGRAFYMGSPSGDLLLPPGSDTSCNQCHRLDPDFNRQYGVKYPGVFGTDQLVAFVFEPQLLKTPHLRNQYQKVGRFGMAPFPEFVNPGDNEHMGDQIDAPGFLHDGSFDSVFRFMRINLFNQVTLPGGGQFNPGGIPVSPEGEKLRRDLEAFMLAFPSNFAPIVGQQVTLTRTTGAGELERVALLRQRADAGECDLVAKTVWQGVEVGYLYRWGRFEPSVSGLNALTGEQLQRTAVRAPLTFTCQPPGTGMRVAVDRDNDGYRDGDEQLLGTNPSSPSSHP
jgi:DNA-binding beta-propeller fold protein YncE